MRDGTWARRHGRRAWIAALVVAVAMLAAQLPAIVSADAPNVREVSPAGININGGAGDWDQPDADFL
ncbi:MAG: hypothetical protein ABWZ82_03950, partial [Candidatus Limnocylindrales bacterium]